MKIGLLTFHIANNYGAFLQTCALQHVLENRENEVFIIDYVPFYFKNRYHIFNLKYDKQTSFIKYILFFLPRMALQLINCPQKIKRNRYFNNSRRQKLHISEKRSDAYFDLINDNQYEVYIAGSDQIWAAHLTGGKLDPAYFFYYLPDSVKTFTYAASTGREGISKEHSDDFREYSKKLRIISVRETSVVPIVKEKTGKDVYPVLDPTLLLHAEDWMNYSLEPIHTPQKYLLSYYFHSDSSYFHAIKNIAKKSNLDIVWIYSAGSVGKYFVKHNYVRPEEFIWYFANAEAVVTDSFHGTMFSIINKKPFYSVAPYPQSVRIEDHLKRFGLLDRLYDSANKLPDTVTEIDYTKSYEKLEEWRKKSFDYLDMITKPDVEQ